jgi:hypothetical protein
MRDNFYSGFLEKAATYDVDEHFVLGFFKTAEKLANAFSAGGAAPPDSPFFNPQKQISEKLHGGINLRGSTNVTAMPSLAQVGANAIAKQPQINTNNPAAKPVVPNAMTNANSLSGGTNSLSQTNSVGSVARPEAPSVGTGFNFSEGFRPSAGSIVGGVGALRATHQTQPTATQGLRNRVGPASPEYLTRPIRYNSIRPADAVRAGLRGGATGFLADYGVDKGLNAAGWKDNPNAEQGSYGTQVAQSLRDTLRAGASGAASGAQVGGLPGASAGLLYGLSTDAALKGYSGARNAADFGANVGGTLTGQTNVDRLRNTLMSRYNAKPTAGRIPVSFSDSGPADDPFTQGLKDYYRYGWSSHRPAEVTPRQVPVVDMATPWGKETARNFADPERNLPDAPRLSPPMPAPLPGSLRPEPADQSPAPTPAPPQIPPADLPPHLAAPPALPPQPVPTPSMQELQNKYWDSVQQRINSGEQVPQQLRENLQTARGQTMDPRFMPQAAQNAVMREQMQNDRDYQTNSALKDLEQMRGARAERNSMAGLEKVLAQPRVANPVEAATDPNVNPEQYKDMVGRYQADRDKAYEAAKEVAKNDKYIQSVIREISGPRI